MVDHKRVYKQEGDQYQRLIAREDFQQNLLPAIRKIISPKNLDVVDLGSGTGRLPGLLARDPRTIFAFDLSPHMLIEAAEVMNGFPSLPWLAAGADHRAIPLPANSADLVVSGWSICYLVVWEGESWENALREGLEEIRRILRPGGTVLIVETLGTGVKEPEPPEKLQAYFKFLEGHGFKRTWIRTDYQFQSQEEAHELVGFFFGEDMLAHISSGKNPILPECTGIWWSHDLNL